MFIDQANTEQLRTWGGGIGILGAMRDVSDHKW